ncbi:zinc finger domain-containing protein [Thermomonospora umbrina]|uniref:DNA-binding phage zinc finger domain-containing protein n=1 Tax=Thermomonospora umbrina TaxID=111806 RepID=A0A3D9SWQ5_9ACTN|nr:hypothetical protein [Thermomonospora umbrina]REF00269.1 hypothetical protein DFJ69_5798 [Thermomonospora umbrina]
MNHEEAVVLVRYVRACCPQQAIDEYTPDAWHDLLGDLDIDACRAAVVTIVRRQPFVAPAEIRAEVRRVREERIAAQRLEAPTPDAAEREEVYRQQLWVILQRAADGHMPFKAIPGRASSGPSEAFMRTRTAEDRDRVLAQTVACPADRCPARPGEPCRPRPGEPPMSAWHPNRLRLARNEELLPDINPVPSLDELEAEAGR